MATEPPVGSAARTNGIAGPWMAGATPDTVTLEGPKNIEKLCVFASLRETNASSRIKRLDRITLWI